VHLDELLMDAGHIVLIVVLVIGIICWAWDHGQQTSVIASLFGVIETHKATAKSLVDSADKQKGIIECFEFENHRLRSFIEALRRQSEDVLDGDDELPDSDGVLF
jgi:hypothetical protein